MNGKSPVLFIPHGGGPLPLLGHEGHAEMVRFLKSVTDNFPRPDSILVISAHWEERVPTITSSDEPSLIYDYYGFPEESYEISYPVKGDAELAGRISELITRHGMVAHLDEGRGLDHGVFVPLKIMYPDAGIPCVQLSLVAGLRPEEHIRLGKAISDIRDGNVLVLGSGFSFHNLAALMRGTGSEVDDANDEFQQWLINTCTSVELAESEREYNLINWENAPFARYCHPREEHLMPLHVCYGVAGTYAKTVFEGLVLGKKTVAFLWQ